MVSYYWKSKLAGSQDNEMTNIWSYKFASILASCVISEHEFCNQSSFWSRLISLFCRQIVDQMLMVVRYEKRQKHNEFVYFSDAILFSASYISDLGFGLQSICSRA